MTSYINYNINREFTQTDNPTPEQVEAAIRLMDGRTRSELVLKVGDRSIVIQGGKDERVMLYYDDDDLDIAQDVDALRHNAPNDNTIWMILASGELDGIPFDETLAKAVAIQIAMRFIERETVKT